MGVDDLNSPSPAKPADATQRVVDHDERSIRHHTECRHRLELPRTLSWPTYVTRVRAVALEPLDGPKLTVGHVDRSIRCGRHTRDLAERAHRVAIEAAQAELLDENQRVAQSGWRSGAPADSSSAERPPEGRTP